MLYHITPFFTVSYPVRCAPDWQCFHDIMATVDEFVLLQERTHLEVALKTLASHSQGYAVKFPKHQ